MKSYAKMLGPVPFPQHLHGARVYMEPFTKTQGLPPHLREWQPTVSAMLEGVDAPGQIYLMIDQGVVKQGCYHRRPGPHVDMNWLGAGHGHGGGHISTPGPGWGGKHQHGSSRQGIILACDNLGLLAYEGDFTGCEIGEGGDCSHFAQGLTPRFLEPYKAWAGDSMQLIHAPLPAPKDLTRTVVRLNVDGWVP